MVLNWLGKILDSNEKQIKKLQPLVDEINSLEKEFKSLKDKDLTAKTKEFKLRISRQESLDDILPEAFAVGWVQSFTSLGYLWESLFTTRP